MKKWTKEEKNKLSTLFDYLEDFGTYDNVESIKKLIDKYLIKKNYDINFSIGLVYAFYILKKMSFKEYKELMGYIIDTSLKKE